MVRADLSRDPVCCRRNAFRRAGTPSGRYEPGSNLMIALWIIVLCGALGIGYAVWATQSVMAADAGSARMQEISAAVREGAQAYLKRQYTTIGLSLIHISEPTRPY